MGMRNPFRFAVNKHTGDVYVGDYSPDANMADPLRGPAGQGRWMLIRRPGQLRLAVLRDARQAVRRLRLHAGRDRPGEEFNCFAPTNDSLQQHRPAPAAAGRPARGLVLVPGQR